MNLLNRLASRYRSGYWEGMASGAAVLTTYGGDSKREPAVQGMVAGGLFLGNTA